jgi:transcription initiation factor TFIIE subunit alpha
MKEDDIIELLKFDRKQLRAYVNTLKNEKFLKVRMRVETDSDGKMTRHNYYFINYLMFVNVVKKLVLQLKLQVPSFQYIALQL